MNGDSDARTSNSMSGELNARVSRLHSLRARGFDLSPSEYDIAELGDEIERLTRALDIERGACLTRGQALTRALRCFDELLDNVWPDGLPSTVDAVVEQMRRALENGKCPSDETSEQRYWHECPHMAGYVPKDYECALCSALGGSR